MAEARTCPHCGAELLSGALQGQCPRCMARIVFAPGCGEAAGDAEKAPQKTTTPTEFGNESKTTLKVTPEPQFNLVGQRIGRYKLLEQIGEGGFGEVYMAEQIEPVQRKVSL